MIWDMAVDVLGPFLAGAVRRGLTPLGAVVALVFVVPPVGTDARQYAWLQALQYVVFAVFAPMLAVLGLRTARHVSADRRVLVAALSRLIPFMALAITWRLPPVLHALERSPALQVAELVTLFAAGAGVWLELAGPRAREAPLPRPMRATLAAFATWTIWAVAYVTAMSSGAVMPSAPGGLDPATDRQLAAGILWAMPAVCLAPVVYGVIMAWLGEREDPDAELRSGSPMLTGLAAPPRPPRGWRSPS
jgi:Cytochrome c oxidase caa3 assembly factor (Caa3_CtaG)